MKKVLFITHDDITGGSAQSLLAQIAYFNEKKLLEPIVVTWKENSLTEYLRKKGVCCYAVRYDFTSVWTRNVFLHKVKRPYYRLFYNWFAFRTLSKQIDFSTISLIVSNSSVIDLGAYLHRKLHIPHIWFLREFGDLDFNILSYVKNLPRYIDDNSNGIIAVSKAVAEHWSNRGIKKKINVIYNGVVRETRPRTIEKRESIIKICMCGRLCPAKGQAIAIKSLAILPNSVLKEVHLDIFGIGESEKWLRSLVRKEKLEKNVSFKGFSRNLDGLLDEYDMGLTLSKAEAFGRTTVEYMNHALFVIGANTGGTIELLQNGKYGTLVDPSSPKQVADAITDYYKNYSECSTKALLGQSYANENFLVKKCAEQFFSCYNLFLE